MNEILFISFAIQSDTQIKYFNSDLNPQMQTHKFIWKFIRALEYKNTSKINYYSFPIVSSWPRNKKIFFYYKKSRINLGEKDIIIKELPFINFPILRYLTRFLSVFCILLINIFRFNKVILYSVHLPIMLTGVLFSKVFRKKTIGIWTDPPAVHNNRNIISSFFRKVEKILSKRTMLKIDKIISVTHQLSEDYSQNKPTLVIEGFSEENKYCNSLVNQNTSFNVVYTGYLSRIYSVDNIVEAFKKLDDNYILHLYGKGDLVDQVVRTNEKHKNIIYHGFKTNIDEIQEIQANADLLINARGADKDFVKYSFPSKLLEYMSSGTPVLTTLLPGMPAEYKEYLIELKDNTSECIKKSIIEISHMNRYHFKRIGLKAYDFAKTKNDFNQGMKIYDFIFHDY